MASKISQLLSIQVEKRQALFARIQKIYDLSTNIVGCRDTKMTTDFIGKCKTIDSIRSSFSECLDKINEYEYELSDEYIPDFSSMDAFDDLYSAIQGTLHLFENSQAVSNRDNNDQPPHLVKLSVPPFNGSVEDWPVFYQMFSQIVDANKSLSHLDKVSYLAGALQGKARAILSSIAPTAENYTMLLKSLKMKYDDKRTIATSLLDRVMQFRPSSIDSEKSLNAVIDGVIVPLNALRKLGVPDLPDFVLLYIALKKLDPASAKLFENNNRAMQFPRLMDLEKFLDEQTKIIARNPTPSDNNKQSAYSRTPATSNIRSHNSILKSGSKGTNHAFVSQEPRVSGTNRPSNPAVGRPSNISKCGLCAGDKHQLYLCLAFRNMQISDRWSYVKSNRVCYNCLSVDAHLSSNCKSESSCSVSGCNRRHHSMLHQRFDEPPQSNRNRMQPPRDDHGSESSRNNSLSRPSGSGTQQSLCSTYEKSAPATVLLATAIVVVRDGHGVAHRIRCLLDVGSQSNLIVRRVCEKLGLPLEPFSSQVQGIGSSKLTISACTTVEFASQYNANHKYVAHAFVVDRLTDSLPSSAVEITNLTHLQGLELADSKFYEPQEVDMIIGAEFWPILVGQRKYFGSPGAPVAIDTTLGAIVIGRAHLENRCQTSCFVSLTPLNELVEKFWRLEEIPQQAILKKEDVECQQFFANTTTRNHEGRFVVRLPFRQSPNLLGSSKSTAVQRFFSNERRLQKFPEIRKLYVDLVKEYESEGVISRIGLLENVDDRGFFLPHHGVYRAGHPSTPLRIVWNASAPSSSKYTLNQLLHTGPKLQKDIFEILIHFRLFPYAITGDVRRMFLQILVHPNDRCFQRFIFRNDPSEQLSVYEIDSVVFGMTSSPYLAQAVVQSLAQQEKDRFPLASRTALQDMYIDDVTSSVENESLVIATYRELTAMFATAKFTLSKWCSNSPALMDLIAANNDQPASVDFGKAMATKVLGVHWSAADDILRFVNAAPVDRLCTKRNILSTVARTFDPLGLISPVTIIPKLMIKELWDNKIDWDEPAPARVEQMWESFCEQLRSLSDLKFPRHIGVTAESTCCLVGFSDSSSRAYGACVYLRTVTPNLGIKVQLLCAKSRIAPAKILSIPRLELCAALLLAKLMRFVLQSYNARCQFNRICAYTDSQVVLYWIRSDPAKWKTFVSNRISQLQENIAQENWGHVPGKENPADVLSRGIYPAELKTHPLWFHGPSWLHQNPDAWPQCSSLEFDLNATEAESKPLACYKVVTTAQSNPLTSLLDNISSYRKLLRSTAYVFRACSRQHLGVPFVQAVEIRKAELFWIRWVQSQSYENEIKLLEQGKPLVNTNPLLKLDPFVRQGILRVGGRLDKAAIGYDQKHPYLLPSKGKFVDMPIDQCHSDLLHAGPHLTMSRIHSRFWIPSLRARVRSRIRSCNVCFRTKPKPTQPKMASLPALRLQGFKAFRNVGLDFAGPFSITPYRQRGQRKLTKSYFCLFICLTVKAIHIELVSDLTTECFLAAFKRFLCRRGPCEELRSDGGLTFVGARRKLNELETLISSSSFAENVGGELAGRGITWKVNPPYGPNFGGIWESNIKCVKQHLSRIIGNQVLTYEEFNTVLIQIEAILNSRPLCVLSHDPSAPAALTPAHFLTLGSTLDEIPAEDVAEIPISRLQRYEQIDHIVQNFWKRWRTEFLHTLQLRSKWRLPTTPIEKGAVVVLSKDNYPPLKWPLGIVEKVFPGTDGVIRVVEIRTPSGVYRRPVNKVCPLPSQ